MRLTELQSKWNEEEPLKNTPDPLSWWDEHYVRLLKTYSFAKNAKSISHEQAEMLIGANENLFNIIDSYKAENTPFENNEIISIIKRIVPIKKTLFRGTENEYYDEFHTMPIQSWSENNETAKHFGNTIKRNTSTIQGIKLQNIYYWNGLLYGNENGLGDSQAEWLILPPKSVKYM